MTPTIKAKQLKEWLRKVPDTANVCILTDTSDDNWDEENERWFKTAPIVNYSVEKVEYETNRGFGKEINLLIEIEPIQ